MSSNLKGDSIIKLSSIRDKKFELYQLGQELISEDCSVKIDFNGVERLSKNELELIFRPWSQKEENVRRDISEFIYDGICSTPINDSLDKITKDPEYFNKSLNPYFFIFWFIYKKYRLIIALTIIALFVPLLSCFWKFRTSYRVDTSEVVIGTIYKKENLEELEKYLEDKVVPNNFIKYILNERIDVILEGHENISYEVAEYETKKRKWDIFFTSSPILSIKSKKYGYSWGFKMFPEDKSDTYTSGLFVRSDSTIQGIDQINASTTLALGEISRSASSFVVPVYELFGKSIKVSTGHRGHEIRKMVRSGKVEIGAAAISANEISKDSRLRLILESRPIPGSGVYFSPALSLGDQEQLKQAMEAAPTQMKLEANYGVGQEPKYEEFESIMETVEEILICADFSNEIVNVFCPKGFKPKILVGKINGWKAENNNYVLFLKDENNGSQLNHIVINKKVFRSIFESNTPQNLQNKKLRTMTPKSENNSENIPIVYVKGAEQIEVID